MINIDTDLLNRAAFIQNMMGVINNWDNMQHENRSMSIAVNAPWGSGKSFLLNLWKDILLNNTYGDSSVVFYDAWKSDNFDNAFIPLLFEFTNISVGSNNYEIKNTIVEKGKALIKHGTVAILKTQLEKMVGKEYVNEINSIDCLNSIQVDNIFKEYETYLKSETEFSNSLIDLIPQNGKLFVFIDELDRCKPKFAIDTLEIIKHYCNISNIVFVYAVDLQQMSYSIQSCYGIGMDSVGYLRRFFDYNINLPNTNIINYINHTINKIVSILDERLDLDTDEWVNMFIRLELSLRDINKITDNIIVFCSFYKNQIIKNSNLNNLSTYIYFITLKYKNPTVYSTLLSDYGYILSNNELKYWPVIDEKMYSGMKISKLIETGQTGVLSNNDGSSIVNSYGFPSLKSNKKSFSYHIRTVLELVK